MTPRSIIQVRWPNDDEGGYFKVPGCLVAEGVALVIFDENIEVHLVDATSDDDEFDLLQTGSRSNQLLEGGLIHDDTRTDT